jgi:ABC-type transporter Mla MlaB component
VDRYVLEDVTAELDRSAPELLAVSLSGRITIRDAGEVLGRLFQPLLASGREERRAIALHFERLQHFNSATIAALVRFIRAAQSEGVALTVIYDANQRWQAISFDALRRALRPFEDPAVRFAPAGD